MQGMAFCSALSDQPTSPVVNLLFFQELLAPGLWDKGRGRIRRDQHRACQRQAHPSRLRERERERKEGGRGEGGREGGRGKGGREGGREGGERDFSGKPGLVFVCACAYRV